MTAHQVWSVHPFVVERTLRGVAQSSSPSPHDLVIEGFSDIPDEELDRYKLDRWFVRGARELLRADAPRRAIRWLRSSDSIPSVLGFDPREARLGIVERERTGELNFPPPNGQSDYAAIAVAWLFSSNSIGLT